MRIFLSTAYLRNLKKITRKNPQQIRKIKERVRLFQINPNHSSLKLHKLKGQNKELWSFSIEEDLRILLVLVDGKALLLDIGRHEDIY